MSSTTQPSTASGTFDAPHEAPEAQTSQRLVVLDRALMAAAALAVLLGGWLNRWTSDDAFINFRVVENLLAGNGPVYSAPERVEVATSPLWLFVLTVAEAVVPGDNVAWASVVLGLLLSAIGVLVAMLGARRLFARTPGRLMVPPWALPSSLLCRPPGTS